MIAMGKWLVIGISGVTCGGKSTMAAKLHALYPTSRILCMDNYFFSVDNPCHKKANGVKNQINWEHLGALDIEKWKKEIQDITELNADTAPVISNGVIPNFKTSIEDLHPTVPIPSLKDCRLLILDGFLALNEHWTVSRCDIKFYITLTKEQCWERRKVRNYTPPDLPGYFDKCVWPEHLKMKAETLAICPDVILLDGAKSRTEMLNSVLQHIETYVAKYSS